MLMKDKTLIFDLGGVLLDWDPRYLYRKVFTDEKEMEHFLAEVCSPAWNAQMDAGKNLQDGISELLSKYPAYTEQIRFYQTRWFEMLKGEFPGSIAILEELKLAEFKLAVLSNFPADLFQQVKEGYQFLDWFDLLIISGEVGVAKPHPAIYQILLRELGQSAEECVFIDDRLENIAEADRQGFETIHFDSAEKLRSELVDKRLL